MKTCQSENCNNRVFAKGYCRYHQHLRPDFKAAVLKRQPVRKVSDKERVRQQQYRKQRIAYLKANPFCGATLEGCTRVATTVHHKRGRMGANLLDVSTWLPACMSCHEAIERNPAMAKEAGLSISRLNKAS